MRSEKPAAAPPSEPADLGARYGEIGISAVAAAIRYQGEPRNLAYAPVELQWDGRPADLAA